MDVFACFLSLTGSFMELNFSILLTAVWDTFYQQGGKASEIHLHNYGHWSVIFIKPALNSHVLNSKQSGECSTFHVCHLYLHEAPVIYILVGMLATDH